MDMIVPRWLPMKRKIRTSSPGSLGGVNDRRLRRAELAGIGRQESRNVCILPTKASFSRAASASRWRFHMLA